MFEQAFVPGQGSTVFCKCGWSGSPGQLVYDEKTSSPYDDVPRLDFRCPRCKEVTIYGHPVMGFYMGKRASVQYPK